MTCSQHPCCMFGGLVFARKSTKLHGKLTLPVGQPCFGQKDTDWGSGPAECGISFCPKNEKPLWPPLLTEESIILSGWVQELAMKAGSIKQTILGLVILFFPDTSS